MTEQGEDGSEEPLNNGSDILKTASEFQRSRSFAILDSSRGLFQYSLRLFRLLPDFGKETEDYDQPFQPDI
jgi:hypothetical protein